MSKAQKIWLWIFGAMFLIPEIIFSTTLSSIINYSGKDFLTLSSLFVDGRFFINNPAFFYTVLLIEIIAIVGLLILSIKSSKKIVSVIPLIILMWLIFVFFLGYISDSINLFM